MRVLFFFMLLLGSACGEDSFQVQRAPEFPRATGAHLSVFGVYKDGRLAPEAWDPLRVHLSPLFGTTTCDPGYPDLLMTSGSAALTAVDSFTRSNGVTDELLDRIAPSAKGDLILLVMETGRPGPKADKSEPGPSASAPTPSMRTGGRQGAPPPMQHATADASVFEAVAVLFSVKAHKSVGAIRMSYGGPSFDDAMQSFFTRVGAELPGVTCAGWKGDLHLTPADVAKLETE